MDDTLVTIINILFYIVIFRFIASIFRRKKPQNQRNQSAEQTSEQGSKRSSERVSEQPVRAERKRKSKKKESFFDEAMKQLKKLEELADPKPKKKEKKKIPQPQVEEPELTKDQIRRDRIMTARKENDEKTREIYYNKGASTAEEAFEPEYRLRSGDLKKAIVYAEIIGPPVSKKPGIPVRR